MGLNTRSKGSGTRFLIFALILVCSAAAVFLALNSAKEMEKQKVQDIVNSVLEQLAPELESAAHRLTTNMDGFVVDAEAKRRDLENQLTELADQYGITFPN